MKKMKNICLIIILVYMIIVGNQNVYAEPVEESISDETLDIIYERVKDNIKKGNKYIDFTDLKVFLGIMPDDSKYNIYLAINDVVCKARDEQGCFYFGSVTETFCNYKIITEPTEEAIALGNTYNEFMGVEIEYSKIYTNEDGTGNVAKIAEDATIIKKEFERALSLIDDEMSDFEKALVLHDYLVAYVNYPDADKYVDGVDWYKDEHYTMAELVARGEGVCVAYARAYRALLKACNIPSITVGSVELNHEWNMIKLENEWYHVDVTWDDEKYIAGITSNGDFNEDSWDIGAVIHSYYLLTDDEMREMGRDNWHLSYEDGELENEESQENPPLSAKEPYKLATLINNTEYYSGSVFSLIGEYWYILDRNNGNIAKINANNPSEYVYVNVEVAENIKYVYGYEKWLVICTEKAIYIYDTEGYSIEKVINASDISSVLLQKGREAKFSEMCVTADVMKVVFVANDEISEESYNMYFEVSLKDYIKDGVNEIESSTSELDETTSEIETTKENVTTNDKETIKEDITTNENETTKEETTTKDNGNEQDDKSDSSMIYVYVGGSVVVVILIGILIFAISKKTKNNSKK